MYQHQRRYAASAAGSQDDVVSIVKQLQADPELLEKVLENMEPEARRRLIVAGGAYELFGKDSVASEVANADQDKDHVISHKDFHAWFVCALRRKSEETSATAGKATAECGADIVPLRDLFFISLQAGLPFVGFGCLDNAVMILSGDLIDHTLGAILGITVLASAALGNVVSGVFGMQVHGLVERLINKLGLPSPALSDAQRQSRRVFLAGHIGGTVGIIAGLLLGMTPLLFLGGEEQHVANRIFKELDADKSGYLHPEEIETALHRCGFKMSKAEVVALVDKYDKARNGKLDFDEFLVLYMDVKAEVTKLT